MSKLIAKSILCYIFSQIIVTSALCEIEPTIEIDFGDLNNNDEYKVYISPSCYHCAKFILGKFLTFVEKNKAKFRIKLILLPITAKDIYIINLILKRATNKTEFFKLLKVFMRELLKIKKLNIGKLKKLAKQLKYKDEDIKQALPNMNRRKEKKLIEYYSVHWKILSQNYPGKEIDLPINTLNERVILNKEIFDGKEGLYELNKKNDNEIPIN
ncbi:MAG: hypothetical protein LBF70_00730 [Holosporales bacterium]|jgi:hypothetical protein|nr:hypothetical protein [Holosporales bacterium]